MMFTQEQVRAIVDALIQDDQQYGGRPFCQVCQEVMECSHEVTHVIRDGVIIHILDRAAENENLALLAIARCDGPEDDQAEMMQELADLLDTAFLKGCMFGKKIGAGGWGS